MWPAVFGKPELHAIAQELAAGNGWTDVLFDVGNNQVGAREMADVRRPRGVVHGVRHVPHQHDVLAILGHLPQPERPSQDAHVGMHAGQDHVLDPALFEDAPDFFAPIADEIPLGVDGHPLVLFRPRRTRVAAHRRQFGCPLGVLLGIVIFAAVRLVDRVHGVFFGRDFGTPRTDIRRQVGRPRRLGRPLPRGMPGISRHAIAGSMDDRHLLLPGLVDHFVQPRSQLLDAPHRVQAVVQIPDVADDQGRLNRLPGLVADQGVMAAAAGTGFLTVAKLQRQFCGPDRSQAENNRKKGKECE